MVRMREAGYTLEEIAETFNVTKQRISQKLSGVKFNKPAISAIIPDKKVEEINNKPNENYF